MILVGKKHLILPNGGRTRFRYRTRFVYNIWDTYVTI
jgi:hypothetical protein